MADLSDAEFFGAASDTPPASSGIPDDQFMAQPAASVEPDDDLVNAVKGQESDNRPGRTSPAGARGVMQVEPDTAKGVAKRLGVAYDPDKLLNDDAYNTKIGRAYLGEMLQRYGGDRQLALAAYNAGPGAVDSWLAGGAKPGGLPEETRKYVPSVLARLSASGSAGQPTISDDEFMGTASAAAEPTWGEVIAGAVKSGLASNIATARQTIQAATGKPIDDAAKVDPRLAPYLTDPYDWSLGLPNLKKIVGKNIYGLTESAPEMGGAIAGGAAGVAAVGGPEDPLAIISGPVGAGLGAAGVGVAKSLAPIYAEKLKASPGNPDAAFDAAWKEAAQGGLFTGLAFGAFGIAPFQSGIKNVLLQAFGVQPAIGGAEKVATNIEQGRPTGEGVGTAAAEAGAGVLVPMVPHLVMHALAGRRAAPATEPGQEAPGASPGPGPAGAPPGAPGGPPEAGRFDHRVEDLIANRPIVMPPPPEPEPPKVDPMAAVHQAATAPPGPIAVPDHDGTVIATIDTRTGEIKAPPGAGSILDMPAKIMAEATKPPPAPAPPAATPPPIVPPVAPHVAPPPEQVRPPIEPPVSHETGPRPAAAAPVSTVEKPAAVTSEPPVSRETPTPTPAKPTPARDETQPAADHVAAIAAEAHPEPTPAQAEAGNYQKGHIKLHGLDIAIENAAGDTRRGVGADGKPWEATLPAHYGYFKRTEGNDGDHVDAYVGPDPQSTFVAVVDQHDPATGKFDEHKVILGTRSLEEATALYDRGFSDGSGPSRRAAVTPTTLRALKVWLKSGKTKTPFAKSPVAAVEKGWTEVGKNDIGQTLYQDQRGVRSYIENGVRRTEPVGIHPNRKGPPSISTNREAHPEFKTAEEAAKPPTEKAEVLPVPAAPEAGTPIAPPEPAVRLAQTLRGEIEQRLVSREKLTWQQLFAIADEAYGGTQAEGKYSVKDAYDAMELAVNLSVEGVDPMRFDTDMGHAAAIIAHLREMESLLPTQTKRTREQIEFQQFSTPPHYAAAIAWLGKLFRTDTVLEPSAGLGGIAVFAKDAAGRVDVNELSERRREMLKAMGLDRVTGENAEQLNSTLPADIKPTVVLMNPPFSQTAGRMGDTKDIMVAPRHIEQALKRLEPGGRLVAIVGEGLGRTGRYTPWWNKIFKAYAVRANIEVSGDVYAKYGTNFGTRVLVIDKTAPLKNWSEVTTGEAGTVAALLPMLESIRNDRTAPGEQPALEPARPESAPPGRVGAVDQPPLPRPAAPLGDREPGDRGGGPDGGREAVAGPAGTAQPEEANAPAGGRPGAAAGTEGTGQARTPGGGAEGDRGAAPAARIAGEVKTDLDKAAFSDAIFAPYTPQRLEIKGAQPHPGNLMQTSAMASVLPPEPTYRPRLPPATIKDGKLSLPQLEAVVYAGQAHAKFLPAAEGEPTVRKGFFIGDGTGVGKGREIAGIILDNKAQGRKKSVWVTKDDSKLLLAAQRDMKGAGGDPASIFKMPSGPKDDIKRPEGTTLLSFTKLAKGEARLEQLKKWLGPDFDGVIAFDEAHKMGNAIRRRGRRGWQEPSKTALAGLDLQAAFPKARVVYVSATGATEPYNLAYADRLGLWGRGTPFANKGEFVSQINAGGVAAMELVARDMKAMGMYLSRNLSYDDVRYDRLEHPLEPLQRAMYDRLAEAWQVVLRNINEALQITAGNDPQNPGRISGDQKSAAMSAFWSTHQRFFNQVITSMQMPAVLESADRDLAAGHAPVMQLVNTNEAPTERALAEEGAMENLEELDITPRDALTQMVQNSFPTQAVEQYTDENGNVRFRPVVDSAGKPVQNPEAVARRDKLLEDLQQIAVPKGPLDLILDHFGPDKVAEVTGRGRRVVYGRDKDGNRIKVVEKRNKSAVQNDIQAFADDKKKVLVFSAAGGTGVDYHASNEVANQRLRKHYLVQAGWRADEAVQGLGRTHRSNQKQAPVYTLVTTDLKAQKRFISSIARRLAQLGALTKGQRQATSGGLFSERDNLESDHAQRALQQTIFAIARDQVPGMNLQDFERETGLSLQNPQTGGLEVGRMPPIPQFLNRLLSMKIDTMNRMYDLFQGKLDDIIDEAEKAGTLNVGVETFKADKIDTVADRPVHTDPESGAQTRHVELRQYQRNHPIQWEHLPRQASGAVRGPLPIERYVAGLKSGKLYAVSEPKFSINADGTESASVRFYDQSSWRSMPAHKVYDARSYREVPEPEAQQAWRTEVAKLPEFDVKPLHLITGALLPVWDRIGGSGRVYRLETSEGNRYLGRVIDNKAIGDTLKRLGASRDQRLAPQEAVDAVMQGRSLELANGWNLLKRTVSGEPRIEIDLAGGTMTRALRQQLEADGVITEIIAYRERYFLPTGERAAKTMEAITASRPIVGGAEGLQAALAPKGWDQIEGGIQGGIAPKEAGAYIRQAWKQMGMPEGNLALVGEIQAPIEAMMASGATPGDMRGNRPAAVTRGQVVAASVFNVKDAFDARNTAFHEAFHVVENAGGFTPAELAAMNAEHAVFSRIAAASFGLKGNIVPKESRAYVFGAYGAMRENGVPAMEARARLEAIAKGDLKPAAMTAFERLYQFWRKIAAFFGGRSDDISYGAMESAYRGERGKYATPQDASQAALWAGNNLRVDPQAMLQPGGGLDQLREGVADRVEKFRDGIVHDMVMGVSPMAARSGSDAARAIATEFMNSKRKATFFWNLFDDRLKKQFTADDRRAMWDAMDEQSVAATTGAIGQGEIRPGIGWGRLSPEQLDMARRLDSYGQRLWADMRAAGMVRGEGLAHWTPRMLVRAAGGEGRASLMADQRGRVLERFGTNVRTTHPSLKHRHFLTAAETEAAGQAKLGPDVMLARDIRTMPLAMHGLEDALAGRKLINAIKEMSRNVGEDTVLEDGVTPEQAPRYFTIDNPAFTTLGPQLVPGTRADGSPGMVARVDSEGRPIITRKPLYIRRDFEGPLRAILTKAPGPLYNAFMRLKGGAMSMIMYSPLIHNAVEWGRALPLMPGKVLSFRVYGDGRRALQDPAIMKAFFDHAGSLIGHQAHMQDLSDIMSDPNARPGRGLTAQTMRRVIGLMNEPAGDAVARMIDSAGDLWHNKLLWDQVAKLQMGIFTHMREQLIRDNPRMTQDTADWQAAHLANRFAGALPIEAMSQASRKLANLALFSRTFTLGNLGVFKDAATGLPRNIQSSILQAGGELQRQLAVKSGRKIAVHAILLDVGLMVATNSIVQDVLDYLNGPDKGNLSAIAQGYVERAARLMHTIRGNPLELLDPFALLGKLGAGGDNEAGKEEYILTGYDKDGTAIYAKNPVGKIGMEFSNWMHPIDTLMKKQSTFLAPLMRVLNNTDGFGRPIFDPADKSVTARMKAIGQIAWQFVGAQFPTASIQAAYDLMTGAPHTEINALKTFGPVAGVTFSKGFPGGPAVGEVYLANKEQQFRWQQASPGIRREIQQGNIDGAVKQMVDLGLARGQIAATLRHAINPSAMSPRAIKDFMRYASAEDKARFSRAMGEQASR